MAEGGPKINGWIPILLKNLFRMEFILQGSIFNVTVPCPDVEVTFSCQVPQQSGVLVWRITLLSNGIELMDQLPQYYRTYFMSDQPGSSTVMSQCKFLILFHTCKDKFSSTINNENISIPLSLNTTMVECLPNRAITGLTSDISLFLFL